MHTVICLQCKENVSYFNLIKSNLNCGRLAVFQETKGYSIMSKAYDLYVFLKDIFIAHNLFYH